MVFPADRLTVELVQAIETPTTILIRWPAAPTVTDPRKFAAVASAAVAILAEARARLATNQGERNLEPRGSPYPADPVLRKERGAGI